LHYSKGNRHTRVRVIAGVSSIFSNDAVSAHRVHRIGITIDRRIGRRAGCADRSLTQGGPAIDKGYAASGDTLGAGCAFSGPIHLRIEENFGAIGQRR